MSSLVELITYENVTVSRGDLPILENIDFRLYNAEIVFIIGESGSGKSSFLKSLYGAIDISGDKAVVLDEDLLKIKRIHLQQLRRNLGLVFQDFKIFERQSVFENINYFLQSINVKDKSKRKNLTEGVLEKVGLAQTMNRKAYELSGGEKQRLAIARALVHKPKLIIADEPTGNLNKDLGLEIFTLLRDLAIEQGSSILTATHDKELSSIFSGKFFECKNGRISRI